MYSNHIFSTNIIANLSPPSHFNRFRRPTRDTRSPQSFAQVNPTTPGPWFYRPLQTKPESQTPPSTTRSSKDHANGRVEARENMTLLDIDNFELRSKVAQLMAVAPDLPIRDLYHLIIGSEGQFSKAKKHAIRLSKVPERHHPAAPPLPPSQQHAFNSHVDELMVKIDPNDPAFEWYEDEPAPELVSVRRSYASGSESNTKRSTDIDARKMTTPKKRLKQTAKTCSNIGIKRTKSALANPTHARETSSDREFVVADNVVHYLLGSDDTATPVGVINVSRLPRKVHDSAMLDVDDDGRDLDIDMQPHYAYNRDILKDA
ncbi:hypothetical protein DDE83_008598 [Stemphylium lycopersici]|uniref:Uncharacterized protein n=1 Tax=Stemphylium lycopersici TaxID=183478 RepID=A0A364MSY8_STELY|nr:hypothetical protein DDE83_008598 [Stemphylium lycopersici]